MTEEEKKALADAEAQAKAEADAKAAAEGKNGEGESDEDALLAKDAEIIKLKEDLANYKNVALKRLGKLPADSEFLGEAGSDIQALIEDKVKEALVNREIEVKEQAKETELRRIIKENSELKLALKNRPNGSIGGESGANVITKDNVFTEDQIAALKARAKKLGADPEKFVESAKLNLISSKR